MDSENQVILDFGSRKNREKDKNKIIIGNKILYIFIYIMIFIFLGIIYFIYIKKEIADNAQSIQIKNDLFQKETRTKIINLENKINLLENKIDDLIIKLNEYNLTNSHINNKDYPNKEFESQNKSEQNINKILIIIIIYQKLNYLKYLLKNLMKIFFSKSKVNKWNFVMSKIDI